MSSSPQTNNLHNFVVPSIPAINDVQSLRLAVIQALNTLVAQFNGPQNTVYNMNNNRVSNVANPALQGDAVNLLYLTSALSSIGSGPTVVAQGSGTSTNIYNNTVYTVIKTITSGTTITSPSASLGTAGALLGVRLQQDGSGGHIIGWSSDFRYAPVGLDVSANTFSSFIFMSAIDPADAVMRWWLMGVPISGQA